MALILNIDTAVETASVCISADGEIKGFVQNDRQKDHAAWVHTAISQLLKKEGIAINDLQAVAISIGPGSYTGLRIGLSAAKGLCYALKIPLITIGTLEMMAATIIENNADLFCPLIDARRMEVFTAIYDKSMKEVVAPQALVVDKKSFANLLSANTIIFSGNGSKKLQKILDHPHAAFSTEAATAVYLAPLAERRFLQKRFADVAYVEPFYVKEFHSGSF